MNNTLIDFAMIEMGQSPPGSSYNTAGHGQPLLNGPTEFTELYPVANQWTTKPLKLCKEGDLLICVRGSSTGRTNIADQVYCIGRGVAAIRGKHEVNQYYLITTVESGIETLLRRSTGSTFPSIDKKDIGSLPVTFPPLPTQHRIAAILQTWDRAIQLAEQQLADLQERKRGLMQLLLTGKKRLPEFEGKEEWREVKLGEVISFLKSNSLSRDKLSSEESANGPYVIHYGDLHELGSKTRVNDLSASFTRAIQINEKLGTPLKEGDIVISDASEDLLGIGMSIELGLIGDEQVVPGLHTIAIRPNPDFVSLGFLGFLLSSEEIRNNMRRVSQGASVKGLSKTEVSKLDIRIPSKPEQEKLTTTLELTEIQISDTHKRINSLRLQKRGLMQRLLEGEVEVGEEMDETLGL